MNLWKLKQKENDSLQATLILGQVIRLNLTTEIQSLIFEEETAIEKLMLHFGNALSITLEISNDIVASARRLLVKYDG